MTEHASAQTRLPGDGYEPSGRARVQRRWRLVERSFNLAAIWIVIFLGVTAIQGMQRLFLETPTLTTSDLRENPSPPAVVSFAGQPASAPGGTWEMADWQWDVAVSTVSEAEMKSRLNALARCAVPANLQPHEQTAIRQIVHALRHLPLQRYDTTNGGEYRLDSAHSKLRVLTRGVGEQETLVALAAAKRQPSRDHWTVFELRSKPRRADAIVRHILPLPHGTRTLCGRRDERGQWQLEIVASPVGLASVVDRCRAAGWQVGGLPASLGSRQGFSLTRERQTVHLWSVDCDSGWHQFAAIRMSDNQNLNFQ